MTWRDVIPPHPAAEMLPLLSPEELADLAADIQDKDLAFKVDTHIDSAGKLWLIEGRNRMDAMQSILGWEVVTDDGQVDPRYGNIPKRGMTDAEITAYVI